MVRIHVVWSRNDKSPELTDSFIKRATHTINKCIYKFKQARSSDDSTKTKYETFGEQNTTRVHTSSGGLLPSTEELTLVWDDQYILNRMSCTDEIDKILTDPERLVLFVGMGKQDSRSGHPMMIVKEDELVNVIYHQACYICYEKRIEDTVENIMSGHSVLTHIQQENMKTNTYIRPPKIANEENKFTIIKRIVITTDSILILFEKRELNRMLYYRKQDIDKFLICQLDIRLSRAPVLCEILSSSGIQIDDKKLIFIGHSNSQLKEFACYLYNGNESEINLLLSQFGLFSNIKQVAKRSARIGLLFSSCLDMFTLPEGTTIKRINDIERNGMIFSDGCGLMTEDLFEYVSMGILNLKETVSVIQIRLEGCKGVFVKIPKRTRKIHVRNSMAKFEWKLKDTALMGVVQYSRPFKYKYMNEQVIMLLSALGVPNEHLLKIQEEYFNSLNNILQKEEAIKWLLLKDSLDDAEKLLNSTEMPEYITKRLISIREEEVKQNMLVLSSSEKIKEKLRIPIMESRILFGVCDDGLYRSKKKLKQGQCFIRIKQFNNPNPEVLVGKVIVAKNPCYYPGDIRILEAVNIPDFNHLSECIIFNTEGHIPVAHSMAGSDLDGDQYFVCWREDLIPKKEENPFGYPGSAVESKEDIKIVDMVNQFINFDRTISGSVDAYYHFYKDRIGVNSKECRDLGTKWFSKAVDSGKSGEKVRIPAQYRNYYTKHKEDPVNPKLVWNIMKENIRTHFGKDKLENDQSEHLMELFTKSEMEEIFLSEDSFPYSEFYRFKMVYSWCKENRYPFSEYVMLFDYSKISDECKLVSNTSEKFVRGVLLDNNIDQKILNNALYGSEILNQSEFTKFKSASDTEIGFWKLYWKCDTKHSTSDEREILFKHMVDSLTRFKQVMFVFQFSSKIKLVVEIESNRSLNIKDDNPIPYGVSSYLISHGKRRPYYMGEHALISISDMVIQIYRNEKRQTFVWIKLERDRISGDKYVNLSVDIESFQKGIIRNDQHQKIHKQTFEFIEVFIRPHEGNLFSNEPLLYLYENSDQGTENDDWPFKKEEEQVNLLKRKCEYALENMNSNKSNFTAQLVSDIGKLVDLYEYSVVVELFSKKSNLPSNIELQTLVLASRIILGQPVHQYLKDNEELQKSLLTYMLDNPSTVKNVDSNHLVSSLDFKKYLLGGNLPTKKHSCSLKEYTQLLFHYILGEILTRNQPNLDLEKQILVKFNKVDEFEIPLSEFDKIFEMKDFKQINPKLVEFKKEYMNLLCLELAAEIRNSMLSQTSLKKGKIIQKDGSYELVINEISSIDLSVGDLILLVSPFSLRNVFSRPTKSISFTNSGHLIFLATMEDSLQLKLEVSEWQQKYLSMCEFHVIKLGNLVTFSRSMSATLKCCAHVEDSSERYLISRILENTTVPQEQKEQQKDCEVETFVPSEENSKMHLFTMKNSTANFTLPNLDGLNEFQKIAIKEAMSRPFYLLQGPPGTGKTNSIAHLVKCLIENDSDSQILAVSETNHATDNMLLKMMELIPQHDKMLRVTGQSSISSRGVHPNLVKLTLEFHEQSLKFQKVPRAMIKKELKEKVKNSRIICSTLAGCGLSVFKNTKIKYVIVDEVSQTSVQKCLIALTLSTQIEKIILVGDDKQLPPTIFSLLAQKRPSSQSLYNYMVKYNRIKPDTLKVQYRMHPTIVKFSNEKFYGNELESGENTKNYQAINEFHPVTFLNVKGDHKRRGTSIYNELEARTVIQTIQSILIHNQNMISSADIGVITPYLAQVSTVKQLLEEKNLGSVEVKTVDGFQGREKEIIIISMVRSEFYENEGKSFISDENRMNVMLTRAKRALVVIGNQITLSKYSIWKEWLIMYGKVKQKPNQTSSIPTSHTVNEESLKSQTKNNTQNQISTRSKKRNNKK